VEVEDVILESVDRLTNQPEALDEVKNFFLSLTSGLTKGSITVEEASIIAKNVLLIYPALFVDRILDIASKVNEPIKFAENILKILEEDSKGCLLLCSRRRGYGRKAKIRLTSLALHSLIYRGFPTERLRRLERIAKNIKRLEVTDATSLIWIYISLSLGYASLGFFSNAFRCIERALKITKIAINAPEVLLVLKQILLIYRKATRVRGECLYAIDKLREFVNSLQVMTTLDELNSDIFDFVTEKYRESKEAMSKCDKRYVDYKELKNLLETLREILDIYEEMFSKALRR